MSEHNVVEFKGSSTIADVLTDMIRAGAKQLIYQYSGLVNTAPQAYSVVLPSPTTWRLM